MHMPFHKKRSEPDLFESMMAEAGLGTDPREAKLRQQMDQAAKDAGYAGAGGMALTLQDAVLCAVAIRFTALQSKQVPQVALLSEEFEALADRWALGVCEDAERTGCPKDITDFIRSGAGMSFED